MELEDDLGHLHALENENSSVYNPTTARTAAANPDQVPGLKRSEANEDLLGEIGYPGWPKHCAFMNLMYTCASASLEQAFNRRVWAACMKDFALHRHEASVNPHPDPAIPAIIVFTPHLGNVTWIGGDGIGKDEVDDGDDDEAAETLWTNKTTDNHDNSIEYRTDSRIAILKSVVRTNDVDPETKVKGMDRGIREMRFRPRKLKRREVRREKRVKLKKSNLI